MRLPSRFIRIEKTRGTFAIRNRKTGHVIGRMVVRGPGDTTRTRRVVEDVDVDRDGKVDYYGGTIMGRTKKIRVKASRRAKGYERRV